MSLNFDLSKLDTSVTTTTGEDGRDRMSVVTEAMIFATMAAGLGNITEKNHLDFYARIHTYEKLNGGLRYDGQGGELLFTLDDVRNHVGLSTNVGDETEATWRKRVFTNAMSNYKRTATRKDNT